MTTRYVVVDGSNIATEGRSTPSLAQLDEAVRAFMVEHPSDQVIVVVDASFGYRIDESERKEYEQAEAAGEIVSPPAGAVGRGDGFLLRIADRTDAVVLSNDSFQEFHAEYRWLFDEGRLIGGKPVPGVGWIFTPRSPVRGPRSREVMRAHKKAQKAALKRAALAEGPLADAIAAATAEAIEPDGEGPPGEGDDATTEGEGARGGRRTRRRRSKPAGTVNDPLPFIEFIAEHPLGTEVEGDVEEFTSHGAFVRAGGARCYIPLVSLGDPPPRSAKTVLKRGEPRAFVVQALDPPRRGIELALPGLARVAGTPTEETVEAEISAGRKTRRKAAKAPKPAAEAVAGEVQAAADAQPAGMAAGAEAPAAEPAAPAPVKRSRRAKKAEPAPSAEPAEAASRPRRTRTAAAAGEPAGAAPGGEPVPAKARRTRTAAAAGEPAGAAPGGEPEPAPSAEPAEAASRPRRTRTAAAAGEPAGASPGGEPVPAKARRSRKAAVTPEDPPAPEPAAGAPPPARARRPRKSAPPAGAAQEPAEDPRPVPAKARRSGRAAVPAAGPAAEPEPAPAVKAPTRRAKKAVATAAAEPSPAARKATRRSRKAGAG